MQALRLNHEPMSEPSSGVVRVRRESASSGVRPVVRESRVRERPGTFTVDLLGRIERVGGTFSVAYHTEDGHPVGEVLVAAGRVGYVHLASGHTPLGERLIRRDPDVAAAVRVALGRARSEGVRLGEALVALGATESNLVREALLDQMSEGLHEIAIAVGDGVVETWRALPSHKVPSRIADFAPVEVHRRAIPALLPRVNDAAAQLFDELSQRGIGCALFAREGEIAIALDTRCDGVGDVSALVALSRLAAGIAAPSPAEGVATRPELGSIRSEAASVLWLATRDQIFLAANLKRTAAGHALSRAHSLLGESSS